MSLSLSQKHRSKLFVLCTTDNVQGATDKSAKILSFTRNLITALKLNEIQQKISMFFLKSWATSLFNKIFIGCNHRRHMAAEPPIGH